MDEKVKLWTITQGQGFEFSICIKKLHIFTSFIQFNFITVRQKRQTYESIYMYFI